MSEIANSKLAIIGAGAVGSSLAYAALIRQSAREVVLYDINGPKVEAEVLDLAHGTQFTGASCVAGGSDLDDIAGANMVVITAGARQHPGQSRLEMAGVNVGILRELMPRLVERAPDAVYMLVTNPCDVLAYAARQFSGLPAARVFGSGTVLDSSRLRWMLAHRVGVAIANVHAVIVGEHGDSEFPLWSQARIGPISLAQWVQDDISPKGLVPFSEAEFEAITESVKSAAYKVIAGKGATNYAIDKAMMSAGSRVTSVLKKACGSRFSSGSRTRTHRTGSTGVPGLYHKAMSDVISSALPSAWPDQAEAIIFVQLVAGLDSRVLSFGSAGPFCAGRPIVREVRFTGGANRLASNRSRLMSVARCVMA